MIDSDQLRAAIADFLPRQRWFGGKDVGLAEVVVEKIETLKDTWPLMVRVEAEAVLTDNTSERYHIVVGLRQRGELAVFLEGKAEAVLGEFETELGPAYGYDALRDQELSLALLRHVAPDAGEFQRVRPVGVEQTHSSLVFDEQLIMKLFRRLGEGPNPDLEVTRALNAGGFKNIAELVGEWRTDGTDLAMLQRFLAGGAEGWALAVTSLRDLYERGGDPATAGGDFSAEAERLGETTAELHLALRNAFGAKPGDAEAWATRMREQLRRIDISPFSRKRAEEIFEGLASIADSGPSLRVHGDYHLGQVLRWDLGWFVFDFEGEPARPEGERSKTSSPLKDIAGILRSLHYASRVVLLERAEASVELAEAWEMRNRQAFLDGYVAAAHRYGGILPEETSSFDMLLKGFELDKAIYELGYERAHRPDWEPIPVAALERLLEG